MLNLNIAPQFCATLRRSAMLVFALTILVHAISGMADTRHTDREAQIAKPQNKHEVSVLRKKN